VKNTEWMMRNLEVDPRVRPLILVVKHWAKCRGVCDARNSTLSSYGWSLLVIHFLQHTSPPVLPVLQKGEDGEADWAAPADWTAWHWNDLNVDTVGTLLVKFFAYYGLPQAAANNNAAPETPFNMFRHVVTLDGHPCRTKGSAESFGRGNSGAPATSAPHDNEESAGNVPASVPAPVEHAPTAPWWRLSITDPLDPSHDVGRVVCRYEGQVLILDEMRRALHILLQLAPGEGGGQRKTAVEKHRLLETLCALNEFVPDLAVTCHVCGEVGHFGADCAAVRCKHCTATDHTSRDCPKQICFRCRGYHLKRACPLANGADRASSIIPMSFLTAAAEETAEGIHEHALDGDGFMREVLSWRSADFLNNKLFESRLRRIPQQFSTAQAWYDHFYPFLLEEMRAQIAAVAEKDFFMVPHTPVSFVCDVPADQLPHMSVIPAYMILPTGLDETKFEEACTCTVGLLVKSTRGVSRDLTADTLRRGVTHLLVRIEFMVKEEGRWISSTESQIRRQNPGCMVFKVQFGNDTLSLALLAAPPGGPKWQLYAMGVGTYSAIRTCNALAAKENPALIMPDVVTGDSCSAEPSYQPMALRGRHPPEVSDQYTSALNQSQKDAVTQVLEVGVQELSPIQIIKGPPGKSALMLALSLA
jgi:hypothetical protein